MADPVLRACLDLIMFLDACFFLPTKQVPSNQVRCFGFSAGEVGLVARLVGQGLQKCLDEPAENDDADNGVTGNHRGHFARFAQYDA